MRSTKDMKPCHSMPGLTMLTILTMPKLAVIEKNMHWPKLGLPFSRLCITGFYEFLKEQKYLCFSISIYHCKPHPPGIVEENNSFNTQLLFILFWCTEHRQGDKWNITLVFQLFCCKEQHSKLNDQKLPLFLGVKIKIPIVPPALISFQICFLLVSGNMNFIFTYLQSQFK